MSFHVKWVNQLLSLYYALDPIQIHYNKSWIHHLKNIRGLSFPMWINTTSLPTDDGTKTIFGWGLLKKKECYTIYQSACKWVNFKIWYFMQALSWASSRGMILIFFEIWARIRKIVAYRSWRFCLSRRPWSMFQCILSILAVTLQRWAGIFRGKPSPPSSRYLGDVERKKSWSLELEVEVLLKNTSWPFHETCFQWHDMSYWKYLFSVYCEQIHYRIWACTWF